MYFCFLGGESDMGLFLHLMSASMTLILAELISIPGLPLSKTDLYTSIFVNGVKGNKTPWCNVIIVHLCCMYLSDTEKII